MVEYVQQISTNHNKSLDGSSFVRFLNLRARRSSPGHPRKVLAQAPASRYMIASKNWGPLRPKCYLQGGAPPVISWFITSIKYRYIYHKPKLLEL